MDTTKPGYERVRIRRKHTRRVHVKTGLFWLLIILLTTFIVSALTIDIPTFIEKYKNFMDNTYVPKDTERMQHQQEAQKPPVTHKKSPESRQ